MDLTSAEKTILVQLLKANAALSVVSNYKQLAKFNVRELSTSDMEQKKAVKAAEAAKKGGAADGELAAAEAEPEAQDAAGLRGEAGAAVQEEEKGKEVRGDKDGSVDAAVAAGIGMNGDSEDSDAAAP